MFSSSSGGGGGGIGLEGGRERCEAPFVLVPGEGIDFFGTEGGVRECVEDEMAVAGPASEEVITGAGDNVTNFVLELRPC